MRQLECSLLALSAIIRWLKSRDAAIKSGLSPEILRPNLALRMTDTTPSLRAHFAQARDKSFHPTSTNP